MSNKMPPQDLGAEAAVLGSMLLDPEVIDDVLAVLPDHSAFALPANREVFHRLVCMHRALEPIDTVMFKQYVERSEVLEKIGGVAYIAELAESVPSAANAAHYARRVREMHQRRQVMMALMVEHTLIQEERGEEYLDERVAELNKLVEAAVDYGRGKTIDSIADIEFPIPAEGEQVALLDIDLPRFTSKGYGPYRGDYVIVGARPGTGKTALLMQMAHATARDGGRVLFFSQEMTKKQLRLRYLAQMTGLSAFSIRLGKINPGDWDLIRTAREALNNLRQNLFIAPYHASVEEMTSTVHRLSREEGQLDLICVDYLQLCKTRQKWNGRNELLSIVSSECASWRHDGACVVAASQLNRQSVQRGKNERPRLEDLRDSGSLEQDGDSVWLLHTSGTPPTGEQRKVGLEVAKQRNGPTGEEVLVFNPKRFEFYCGHTPPGETLIDMGE